ncbi:TetR/AcrR family transcriptional regulator [Paenibacillus sp. DMB20]|uniref:TetR/AcrR family transcriptional regulator n=1 Tax=Paenibacillus sp. DMB20 TaxID=1642570 RepID=UPI000627C741|nr:TetR/AcrR family transcriptional regulator [Paenibacillus sp. DMB20]KKO55325.1 hypothetical protein XI25_00765 [Paenibacillus sp. DMB20]
MKDKTFERKTELIEAALNEFTTKSYDDASLNTIIKDAGISKGTFYYHFSDKQALYLYLLKTSVYAKWKFINEKNSNNPESCTDGDIFENFKRQARLAIEFALEYPKYHKLSRMFSKEQGNPIYKVAQDHLGSDTKDILGGMVDKAIKAGNFKKEYSREFLVKTLSYLFSHFHEIFDKDEDFEFERMISNLDTYVYFIRHGMANHTIKGEN